MLVLSSLGPVIIMMKNGLMAHGLYLCVCEGNSVWVCICVPFNHSRFPPRIRLPLPGFSLRPSLNSPRGNGKQSEANCRAAGERHTQVEGEVLLAFTGRSLAVGEQQLADGCEAEMIHTDSAVPVSVP